MKKFIIFNLLFLLLATACQKTEISRNNSPTETAMETATVTNQQTVNTIPDVQEQYYLLRNMYGVDSNPQPHDLFAEDDSLERLKSLNTEMQQNFDFLEIYFQSAYYMGDYKNETKYVYCEDPDLINQEVELDNNVRTTVTPLKTVQIGNKIDLSGKIHSGRAFNESDYNINSDTQEINVILGNAYNDIYDMDDVLKLNLHEKNLKLRVVGFLNGNSYIKEGYTTECLDQYIIMPFYSINYEPENEKESKYQKLFYLEKNTGLIKCHSDDNYENINNSVESITKKYGLLYALDNKTMEYSLNVNAQ